MPNPISKVVIAGLAAFTAAAVVLPTTPAQGFCGPPLGCGPNGGPGGPRPGFGGGHPGFGGGGGGDDADVLGDLVAGAIIGGVLAAHPYGYGGYGYGYVPHYYRHKPHYYRHKPHDGVTRLSQSSKKLVTRLSSSTAQASTTCTTARERKVTPTEPNNTQATARRK